MPNPHWRTWPSSARRLEGIYDVNELVARSFLFRQINNLPSSCLFCRSLRCILHEYPDDVVNDLNITFCVWHNKSGYKHVWKEYAIIININILLLFDFGQYHPEIFHLLSAQLINHFVFLKISDGSNSDLIHLVTLSIHPLFLTLSGTDTDTGQIH